MSVSGKSETTTAEAKLDEAAGGRLSVTRGDTGRASVREHLVCYNGACCTSPQAFVSAFEAGDASSFPELGSYRLVEQHSLALVEMSDHWHRLEPSNSDKKKTADSGDDGDGGDGESKAAETGRVRRDAEAALNAWCGICFNAVRQLVISERDMEPKALRKMLRGTRAWAFTRLTSILAPYACSNWAEPEDALDCMCFAIRQFQRRRVVPHQPLFQTLTHASALYDSETHSYRLCNEALYGALMLAATELCGRVPLHNLHHARACDFLSPLHFRGASQPLPSSAAASTARHVKPRVSNDGHGSSSESKQRPQNLGTLRSTPVQEEKEDEKKDEDEDEEHVEEVEEDDSLKQNVVQVARNMFLALETAFWCVNGQSAVVVGSHAHLETKRSASSDPKAKSCPKGKGAHLRDAPHRASELNDCGSAARARAAAYGDVLSWVESDVDLHATAMFRITYFAVDLTHRPHQEMVANASVRAEMRRNIVDRYSAASVKDIEQPLHRRRAQGHLGALAACVTVEAARTCFLVRDLLDSAVRLLLELLVKEMAHTAAELDRMEADKWSDPSFVGISNIDDIMRFHLACTYRLDYLGKARSIFRVACTMHGLHMGDIGAHYERLAHVVHLDLINRDRLLAAEIAVSRALLAGFEHSSPFWQAKNSAFRRAAAQARLDAPIVPAHFSDGCY